LQVVLGQRLRAKYVNNTNVSSSIHWHGMILPNAMDGVVGVTQKGVAPGGSFLYEFTAGPSGTRWYHDHDFNEGTLRGLYGMIVVEDPRDDKPDAEFALVFHDVPRVATIGQAMRGVSHAPMIDPMGSPELLNMVTQTRYVRLAGHKLRVTHADGNALARPLEVDALRIGIAERYDVWFEVTKPGAWLLQGISADPLSYEQAIVVHTEGMEHATPMGNSQSLEGVDYFSYEKAAGLSSGKFSAKTAISKSYTIGSFSKEWTPPEKMAQSSTSCRVSIQSGSMCTASKRRRTKNDATIFYGVVKRCFPSVGGLRFLTGPIMKTYSWFACIQSCSAHG